MADNAQYIDAREEAESIEQLLFLLETETGEQRRVIYKRIVERVRALAMLAAGRVAGDAGGSEGVT